MSSSLKIQLLKVGGKKKSDFVRIYIGKKLESFSRILYNKNQSYDALFKPWNQNRYFFSFKKCVLSRIHPILKNKIWLLWNFLMKIRPEDMFIRKLTQAWCWGLVPIKPEEFFGGQDFFLRSGIQNRNEEIRTRGFQNRQRESLRGTDLWRKDLKVGLINQISIKNC